MRHRASGNRSRRRVIVGDIRPNEMAPRETRKGRRDVILDDPGERGICRFSTRQGFGAAHARNVAEF